MNPWWASMWAQAVGELIAGAFLLAVGLYVENYLDELRTQRQDRRERRRHE